MQSLDEAAWARDVFNLAEPDYPVGRLSTTVLPDDDLRLGWLLDQQRVNIKYIDLGLNITTRHQRELIGKWEEKHRLDSQHSRRYPWSPTARARVEGGDAPGALKLEHIWPMKGVVDRLNEAIRRGLTADRLAGWLRDNIGYIVITDEEDKLINGAGMREFWCEDPWDRYRAAGMDPEDFYPPEV